MIARKSALIVITRFLNALLGYVGLFFIARFMGPFPLGIVGFGFGFVALFSFIGELGFPGAHIKRISEGRDLGKCIGTFLSIKIGLAALLAVVLLSSILFWQVGMGRGFETKTHEIVVYLMLIYFVMNALTRTMLVTFRARKEIAKAQTPLFFETFIRVIATIFVAVAGYGAIMLASTYLLGQSAMFFTALILFRGYPLEKPSKEYFKSYYVFALPMILAAASFTIMTNLDKVVIQLFWHAEHVGYYFAILRFTRFILVFSMAVGMLLFPTISTYHAEKKIESIRKLTLLSERYLSMVVFPLCFFLIALSKPIIHIMFSDKFYPAIPILQVLPFFPLLGALMRPYTAQFSGMNRPKLAMKCVVLMMCVNVVLNFILVPKDIKILGVKCFGWCAVGASVATVMAYAVGLVYSRVVGFKLSGTKGNPRILLHLVAASVMACALYYLSTVFFIGRWYQLLGCAFFGLGIYVMILWLVKEFTREDFEFFIGTLHLRKMKDYVVSEIKR